MLTHVLRVVCRTDQPLFFTSPFCSDGQPDYGCERRCVGHVPRGQWAPLGADMLVLIDWFGGLVVPCTCGRHTECSPHGLLTVSFVSSIMMSFAPRSLAPALALGLDLLLEDLLLSLHSFRRI